MANNYRKLVLASIFKNEDVSLLLTTKEDYFYDLKSKKIYQWTLKHYSKYKKIPSIETLKSTILAQLRDKGEVYSAYLDALDLVDVSSVTSEEVSDGLAEEYKVFYVDQAVRRLVDAAEEKDTKLVKEVTSEISNVLSMDASVLPTPITDLEIKADSVKILDPFLPTMHNKGLGFSGVTLVSAASGGGKSIFALNQAVHTYQNGGDILYLNIEINSQEQLLRTVSKVGGIKFDTIYNVPLDESELMSLNEIKDNFFSQDNKFKMVNAPLDADTLVNIIESEVPSGLDMVVLDYVQLVENSTYEKSWEFLQNLIKRLHRLALKHKIVILTPIQINASEIDVDNNTIDITTRGSRELEFTSTVWLHIHQEPDEKEESVVRVFTVKSRNSEKHTYLVKTEFNKMTFEDTGIVL
jgi:replicative DNA helicase